MQMIFIFIRKTYLLRASSQRDPLHRIWTATKEKMSGFYNLLNKNHVIGISFTTFLSLGAPIYFYHHVLT